MLNILNSKIFWFFLVLIILFVILFVWEKNNLRKEKEKEKSLLAEYESIFPESFFPRLKELWEYYVDKAVDNRVGYHFLTCLLIILPALVLLISSNTTVIDTLFSENGDNKVALFDSNNIISIISFFSTVTGSLSGVFKTKEKWVQYRTSIELLKRETQLYYNQAKPYDNPSSRDSDFINKIEEIAGLANKQITEIISKSDSFEDGPKNLTVVTETPSEKAFNHTEQTGVILNTTRNMEYKEQGEENYHIAGDGRTENLKPGAVYYVRYKSIPERGIGASKDKEIKIP